MMRRSIVLMLLLLFSCKGRENQEKNLPYFKTKEAIEREGAIEDATAYSMPQFTGKQHVITQFPSKLIGER